MLYNIKLVKYDVNYVVLSNRKNKKLGEIMYENGIYYCSNI